MFDNMLQPQNYIVHEYSISIKLKVRQINLSDFLLIRERKMLK